MKRVIVNLVSTQTIPNFLFIKEMMETNDRLLFITSEKFVNKIDFIIKALSISNNLIEKPIVFINDAEENWSEMINTISERLEKNSRYIVNLTCGTKYMISAIPRAFEKFDAEFYYIPYPKNKILQIGNDNSVEIKYRASIKEYLECNRPIKRERKKPLESKLTKEKEYTKTFFQKFINNEIDKDVLERIRTSYRKKRIKIQDVEVNVDNHKNPQPKNLSEFLTDINFPLSEPDYLTKEETVYLTGGWFEEYIFNKIKESINPDVLVLGLDLLISEEKNIPSRDLDVVFMYKNKLFVIECKTGINEKILTETVYKAAALKNEILGGLSSHSYIFSLSDDDSVKFKNIAFAMGITFFDKQHFINDSAFEEIICKIKNKVNGDL